MTTIPSCSPCRSEHQNVKPARALMKKVRVVPKNAKFHHGNQTFQLGIDGVVESQINGNNGDTAANKQLSFLVSLSRKSRGWTLE